MAMSREQRRALRLLAGSPLGCTEAIMLAHGFTIEMLDTLVRDGLATAEQREMIGERKVCRVIALYQSPDEQVLGGGVGHRTSAQTSTAPSTGQRDSVMTKLREGRAVVPQSQRQCRCRRRAHTQGTDFFSVLVTIHIPQMGQPPSMRGRLFLQGGTQ
jgi:hypothetical protein